MKNTCCSFPCFLFLLLQEYPMKISSTPYSSLNPAQVYIPAKKPTISFFTIFRTLFSTILIYRHFRYEHGSQNKWWDWNQFTGINLMLLIPSCELQITISTASQNGFQSYHYSSTSSFLIRYFKYRCCTTEVRLLPAPRAHASPVISTIIHVWQHYENPVILLQFPSKGVLPWSSETFPLTSAIHIEATS